MKKFVKYKITLVLLVILSFAACSRNSEVTASGVTSAASLMMLLPRDIQGIIITDVHRLMMTEFANKAINEKDNYMEYQNFISDTGLDPRKDIYWIAIAVPGVPEKTGQEGVAVISMTYDKERLLAKLKQEQPGMRDITYNGVTIHTGMEGRGDQPASGAFLDETRAVFGTDAMVRAVIDVHQKKEENVFKNKALSALITEANQDAMVWSAITISPDAVKDAATINPMMSSFEGITAMTMFLDYANRTLDMQIKILGGDQNKNRQLADILTGFKALGASAAATNPDIVDLVNRIDILNRIDFITVSAAVPEDLIQRLSRAASKKAVNMQ